MIPIDVDGEVCELDAWYWAIEADDRLVGTGKFLPDTPPPDQRWLFCINGSYYVPATFAKFARALLPGIDDDSRALAGLRPAVRSRLSAALRHLRETKTLNRSDIMRLGEVSEPQASADIALLFARFPGIMTYDTSRKTYVLKERQNNGHP